MQKIGIIGFGRFGKVLAQLLEQQFELNIFDSFAADTDKHLLSDEKSVLACETIFMAVPIREFETVIKNMAPKLSKNTTIIDVCSVKMYPVSVMEKYLPEEVGIIATHPMFGPDSIDSNASLNMMMHKVRDTQDCYDDWKTFFASKKFNVVELTPEKHDQLAANSQSVVHFVARVLDDFGVQETPIDTQGFKHLLGLVESNCHDTWALFSDLQNYNPYSKDMVSKLEKSFGKIKEHLIRSKKELT